jgi:serine kinase of HPr protein (carbohydrate metabolism regulator)
MSKLVIHATTLSLLVGPIWQGVLIMGPSGIGKSDLALRAIQAGCALISDDYTYLWSSGDQLFASAPDTIAGQIEVRGIGITDEKQRKLTRISLGVLAQSDPIDRMPDLEVTQILGFDIPTIRLNPREASSVSKLLSCLRQICP